MTFRMIAQLWNTNTPAIVSCDANLTENYMYISMKFRTGVHVFCWEFGVFNRSYFQSVSCKSIPQWRDGRQLLRFDKEKTKCSVHGAVKTMLLIASLMFLYIVYS